MKSSKPKPVTLHYITLELSGEELQSLNKLIITAANDLEFAQDLVDTLRTESIITRTTTR